MKAIQILLAMQLSCRQTSLYIRVYVGHKTDNIITVIINLLRLKHIPVKLFILW